MERLRDMAARPGSPEDKARALLQARAPFTVPAPWKSRVRRALERERARPVRPALRGVRLALAGVLLLAGFGGALAAGGAGWLRALLAPAESPAPERTSPRAVERRAGERLAPPPAAGPGSEEEARAVPPPLAEPEVPAVPLEPGRAPPVRPRVGRPLAEQASAAPPAESARAHKAAPSAESEDVALVAEAIRVLRELRDPERAAHLLQQYLDRYPRGALREDALALAIEAAARAPAERRRELARAYLSAYPNGRYRQLAREVLDAR